MYEIIGTINHVHVVWS